MGGAAVIVAGVVVFLNVAGSEVVVTNAGSQPVRVRGEMPAAAESALLAAGVRVPDELRPGVPTVVRMPRLCGVVQAAPGAIQISMLGQSMGIAANCDRLDMNGSTLLGRTTDFDLGARPRREVQFACCQGWCRRSPGQASSLDLACRRPQDRPAAGKTVHCRAVRLLQRRRNAKRPHQSPPGSNRRSRRVPLVRILRRDVPARSPGQPVVDALDRTARGHAAAVGAAHVRRA